MWALNAEGERAYRRYVWGLLLRPSTTWKQNTDFLTSKRNEINNYESDLGICFVLQFHLIDIVHVHFDSDFRHRSCHHSTVLVHKPMRTLLLHLVLCWGLLLRRVHSSDVYEFKVISFNLVWCEIFNFVLFTYISFMLSLFAIQINVNWTILPHKPLNKKVLFKVFALIYFETITKKTLKCENKTYGMKVKLLIDP